MAAPSTFIPDKAPRSFVPDAPSTFVADSPTEEVELDYSRRQMPDLQATTRGGPPLALPDAKVAGAAFDEELLGGIGDVVTQEGVELPRLVPTMEQFRKFTRDPFTPEEEVSTEAVLATPPTTPEKIVVGGLEGGDELVRGVAQFFTSGPGVLQLGVAATPLAPAVYAKWALDMAEAGFTSVEEAWDAFQKSDYRKASKDAVVAFGSFLGAGAAARHGAKALRTPEVDAFNARTEEANQKALEASMPRQDRIAPLEVKIEAEVLRQNNAPATAAVVEQIAKETPALPESHASPPGGPLSSKTEGEITKSNSVQGAMQAEFDALKKKGVEQQSPAPVAETPKTEAVAEQSAASNLPEQPGLKESEMVGMGAAIPEEFKPSQQLPTANKNASIDADRVARGEAPLMSAMRKSDPELWDQAMSVVENDWQAADKLIARHKAEPFVPTDTDLMVLLHRRTDLKNTFAKLSREYAQAAEEGRVEVSEAARQSRDMVLDQLRELEAIVGRGDTAMGTMTGRALRARRIAMNEDYSMASLIVDREASLKRKLTTEEISELETISKDQARVSAELAKKEAELESRAQEIEAREIAARAIADATADAPSPYVLKLAEDIVKSWDARADRARARLREKWGRTSTGLDPTILVDLSEIGVSHLAHAGLDFARWTARMVDDLGEFAEKAKPYFEKAFERAKRLAEEEKEKRAGPKKAEVDKVIGRATPVEAIDGIVDRVGKRFAKNPQLDFSHAARSIARYYVEQGIKKPLELVDAVHAKLIEVMPELTKRETMDALSGYGRFVPLKKDAVSVALRDATGQMQQIAKLEDMAGGKAPLKTGPERRLPTDEERRLIKQVEEAKRRGGYNVTDPATQLRTNLQAAKTAISNQIKDLSFEIEKRERILKVKTPMVPDAELTALRAQRDALRKEHREIFGDRIISDARKLELAEKVLDRQIKEIQGQLESGEIFPPSKPEKSTLTSPGIESKTQALAELKLRRYYERQGLQPSPQPLDVEAQRRGDALDIQIAAIEKQLETEAVFSKGKKTPGVETPENQARIDKLNELKKERQFARERLQPSPDMDVREAAKLRAEMKAAEVRMKKQIDDMSQAIVTRTKIVKNKRKLELDDKLKTLKAKRDFVKEVYDDVFAPEPLTDAQRLAKWKERTQDKIAEYRERLYEKDFAPRKRPEQPRLDPEAIKLRYDLHKVHNALMEMRLRDELKQRTRARKLVGAAANVYRFSRAVKTTGEFSAVLRQGGPVFLSRPSIIAKNLKPMFEALMSEQAQFKKMDEIMTRDNAPLYERDGLQFTEAGVRLSTMEEYYMFRVSEKMGKHPLTKYPIKFVNAFQRAFTTFLNGVRADAYDVLLDIYGDSPVMRKQIANLINVATGRGSKTVGRYTGVGANTVFFAPRHSISRFQMLVGQPMWYGNKETRKMVATEYARALVGASVVYTLGIMAGGDVETDPRHSDFGKIKFGNTRIDPLFGLVQATRFLAQEISGTRVNKDDKVRPLREGFRMGGNLPKRKPMEPSGLEVAGRFGLSKLAPGPAIGAEFISGEQFGGGSFKLSDAVLGSFVPITYGDILKAMEEQGVERGIAIATLAMFGMGVQTYDVNEKRKD